MRLLRSLLPLIGAQAFLAAASIPAHHLVPDAYFEPNHGQADQSTAFLARGLGFTALLQRNGNVIYHPSSEPQSDAASLRIELLGQQAPLEAMGEQPLAAVTNYYRGSIPEGWHSGVRHYQDVRFRGIYPDIDLLWQSRGPDLEYEFMVGAGADPQQIQVHFDGPSRIWLDKQGNLILETQGGKVCHRRAVAWQEIAGKRREIEVGVLLKGATARFQLGPYDHKQPLWIDPILSYSTYLGGAGLDAGYGITVDNSSGIYVTGTTSSAAFPEQGYGELSNCDVFVTKFNESGALLYTTILSSNGNTSGQAIAVDVSGDVYISGTTEASDFPTTGGAWQRGFGGTADAFAAKLNPGGTLVYATYIGGAGQEAGTGIAVDQSGNAYVSGYTASAGFPTTSGAAQSTYRGGSYDAFVVKLNPLGSAAVYATLLGGTGTDEAQAIAVDTAGHACIVGFTNSSDLPVQAPLQGSAGGEGDGLVACLSADGTTWTMVSYLGGSNYDDAYALDLDSSGNLYVAGTTYSANFPTTAGAFQNTIAGGYDAFVVKLSPGGSALTYATFLGGSGSDTATAIAVGSAGDVWTGGFTTSPNFPLAGAWQTSIHGSFDGFISHLSADGTELLASSYLGGSANDQVLGIALGPTGQVFATGSTLSIDFPVTPGAYQATAPAGENAFLAYINPLSISSYSLSGNVGVSGAGPLSGVTIALGGAAGGSTTTDSNGNYTFSDLTSGGSYTLTPSLSGYSFSPSTLTFNNLSANQTANFTAALMSYSISGQVTVTGAGALAGVAVALTGTRSGSATTNSSGNYTFTGLPANGSYAITTTLYGYTFTPANQAFDTLSAGQTANFVATKIINEPLEIFWQDPVSGSSQLWSLGGPQGTAILSASYITSANPWRIVAGADFNGDGYPDMVWQDPATGNTQVWFLGGPQGATIIGTATITTANPWRIVAAGDFNNDGHPDLVWEDPVSGFAQIWYLGGPQGISIMAAANLTLSNPWHIVGSGDFNGDGHRDLLWQDPVSGTVQVWYLGGALGNIVTNAINLSLSNTWPIVAVADFNGDGHPDIVGQDPVYGITQVWLMGGSLGSTVLGIDGLSGPNPWQIVGPR